MIYDLIVQSYLTRYFSLRVYVYVWYTAICLYKIYDRHCRYKCRHIPERISHMKKGTYLHTWVLYHINVYIMCNKIEIFLSRCAVIRHSLSQYWYLTAGGTTTFSIRRKGSRIDWDCVLFILLPDSDVQSGSQSHPKQISGATNIDSVVPAFLLSAFLPRHTFPTTMALFWEGIYVRVIKCFKGLIHVCGYLRARAVSVAGGTLFSKICIAL